MQERMLNFDWLIADIQIYPSAFLADISDGMETVPERRIEEERDRGLARKYSIVIIKITQKPNTKT